MNIRRSAALLAASALAGGALAVMPAAEASAAPSPQPVPYANSGLANSGEEIDAATASTPGSVRQNSDGWCHFTNWGGTFYCYPDVLDAVYWVKPDGYPQVFVIGSDKSVWTRWSSASGTSGWKDYGGTCRPNYGLTASSSGWRITVACVGTDSAWWHRTRNADGNWTAWTKGRGF